MPARFRRRSFCISPTISHQPCRDGIDASLTGTPGRKKAGNPVIPGLLNSAGSMARDLPLLAGQALVIIGRLGFDPAQLGRVVRLDPACESRPLH